jgi:hypothetical protein
MGYGKLGIFLVNVHLVPATTLLPRKILLVRQLEEQLSLELEQPPGVDFVDRSLEEVVVQALAFVH